MADPIDPLNSVFKRLTGAQGSRVAIKDLPEVKKQQAQSALSGILDAVLTVGTAPLNVATTLAQVGTTYSPDAQAVNMPAWIGKGNYAKTAQAMKLAESGVPLEEVWKKTGTFFDPVTGAAKRVLSDKDASLDLTKLKPNPYNPALHDLGINNPMRLEEFLYHPELYKQMPDLKDYKVTGDLFGVGGGSFNPTTKTIRLGATKDPQDALSVILHEVDHAIADTYDLGSGGNSKMFLPDAEQFERERRLARDQLTALRNKPDKTEKDLGTQKALEYAIKQFMEIEDANSRNYWRIGGEAAARSTQEMLKQQDWSKYPLKQIEEGGYYDVPLDQLIASPKD